MKKNILLILIITLSSLPLVISSAFFFLTDPPIWPDEPVFYDTAINLLATGKIFTNINGEISTQTGQVGYGYPPLYFYLLGWWTTVFSSSIEAVRSLSLAVGFASLIVFFNILKNLFNLRLAMLGTLLLSMNLHFARASRLGRMEILTLLFMLLSVYFMNLANQKKKSLFLLLGSLAAILSFLVHPLGSMSSMIYLFNLWISNFSFKAKLTASLSWFMMLIFAIIFWIGKVNGGISALISSYMIHIADKSPKVAHAFSLWQQDTTWWLLLMICLIIIFFMVQILIRFRDKIVFSILTMLFITLTVSLMAKENVYLIYPFTLITLSLITLLFYANKSLFIYKSSLICVILFIITLLNIQYFQNDSLGITNQNNRSIFASIHYDYHEFTKSLIKELPKETKLKIFIASVPDPFFDLKNNANWTFIEAVDPYLPFNPIDYEKTLDSVDYVILTWTPQQFLQDYIEKHNERTIRIGQNNGYNALLVKLKH